MIYFRVPMVAEVPRSPSYHRGNQTRTGIYHGLSCNGNIHYDTSGLSRVARSTPICHLIYTVSFLKL